jgi:hypothetical protein
VTGSVSTVPGAFGPRARTAAAAERIAEHLGRHAAMLFRLREETGKVVELALEPEPSCLLETSQDTRRFFEERVFAKQAVGAVAALTGLSSARAEDVLRRHVGVCFDACHFAVEFENAGEALREMQSAGIRIGKVQVTDALEAHLTGDAAHDDPMFAALERFSDDVYLHQVVESRSGRFTRYLDLSDALGAVRRSTDVGSRVWRIHFHVPVFLEHLGPFGSTQPFLRELFGVLRETAVTEHLEVETYTWDVLPPEHRRGDVVDSIARELEFTLGLVSARRPRENEA